MKAWETGRRLWKTTASKQQRIKPKSLSPKQFSEVVEGLNNFTLPKFSRPIRLSSLVDALQQRWINDKNTERGYN